MKRRREVSYSSGVCKSDVFRCAAVSLRVDSAGRNKIKEYKGDGVR